MAQPANTFSTYDNTDNIQEEVANVISNQSPSETPFISGIGSSSTKNTYTEWLTDVLASASDNKVIEGDDATTDASSKATRVGNYTQISDKVARVTDTDEAVNKFGRTSEMNYQIMKKGKELKTDMENACVGLNNARVAGSDTVARELGSVLSWITTSTSKGGSGADPTGDGTDARTDGTQRAFTEALLKPVLQALYTEGSHANTIMLGPVNKGKFSSFVGNATDIQSANTTQKVVNSVKIYVGDFHTLTVVPNRLSRERDALILDMSQWKLRYLRKFMTKDLAITGDSKRKQLLVEYTLQSTNEKASGLVADLTTS